MKGRGLLQSSSFPDIIRVVWQGCQGKGQGERTGLQNKVYVKQ